MIVLFNAAAITVPRIIRDIPHDGSAFLVYAMMIGIGVFMYLGSRKRPG